MVLNWDKVSSEPVSLREPAVLSQKFCHHMPHIRRIYEIRLELFIQYTRIGFFCFVFRLKRRKTQPNQQSASVWSRIRRKQGRVSEEDGGGGRNIRIDRSTERKKELITILRPRGYRTIEFPMSTKQNPKDLFLITINTTFNSDYFF